MGRYSNCVVFSGAGRPMRAVRRTSASSWARPWRKTGSQKARGPAARICSVSRSRNWPRYSREARSFPALAMPAATSTAFQSASVSASSCRYAQVLVRLYST